jgi:hypothetical protein
VIISRALTELAEFLEPRQQSAGRGRVVLDRRLGERRQTLQAARPDRRGNDRRQLPIGSTEALMRVLGFMVVPANGTRAGSASWQAPSRPAQAPRAPGRSRRIAPAGRVRRSRS